MNGRQSYLDTLNAGRQRRAHSSMEQLNRSLETLEQRIGRAPERTAHHRDTDRREMARRDPLPQIETGRWDTAARRSDSALDTRGDRPAAQKSNGEGSYRTLAQDIER